jgi:ABC-2 type transport system permease protein
MRDHRLAVVARKDFDDAIRSKTVWFISAIFALLVVGITYQLSRAVPPEFPRSAIPYIALGGVAQWITWVVAILALVSGYASIISERRSGSMKILLGLPFDRAEVLVGKMLGRTAVIAVGVAVGFVTIAVSVAVFIGVPRLVDFLWRFLGLFLLTVLLGAVYTVLAVSVSAVVSTRRRAMLSVVGLFFVTQAVWTGITQFVYLLFGGGGVPVRPPDWYLFLTYLAPSAAYTRVASAFDLLVRHPGFALDGVPQRAAQAQQSGSILLSEYTALLVMLLWGALCALLAYSVFRDADLG